MASGFKKRDIAFFLIVLIVVAGILYYVYREPAVTVVEAAAEWSNIGRYENTDFGFSVEYDADLLTKEPRSASPRNVFTRSADQGLPIMGVYVGPYPEGKSFEDMVPLTIRSMKNFFPKGKVHDSQNERHIELGDGTAAYYFEIKLFSGTEEMIQALVIAKVYDKLFNVYALDRESESVEELTAMVQTLKFDVEIDYKSKLAKGVVKPGKLVRTASPAFTMEYPNNLQELPLREGQIFRVGIPEGAPSVEISLNKLDDKKKVDDQLKAFAAGLAKILETLGSDIAIVSNEAIDNYKTYPAYQFVITWKFQGKWPVTHVVHVVAKEKQAIMFSGVTTSSEEEILKIFKTINLDP